MNEAQRRAWRALDIGPAWLARGAGGTGGTDSTDAATGELKPGTLGSAALDEEALGLEMRGSDSPATSPADECQRDAFGRPEPGALDWLALQEVVAGCRACRLCETRRNTVFGTGDAHADWMVIGEAPGVEEDRRGEPFVGKAGQLLDAMLAAVGRSRRSGVFIANVLKCRPPGNRDPQADEAARCEPFLKRQIELVSPKVIVALGRTSAQRLLGSDASLASLRGTVHHYACAGRNIPLVVTYHPAYLLRTPLDKAKAWVDLQLAQRLARS